MHRNILACFLLLMTFSAVAEDVYINDKLRVGVRPGPSNSEAPLTVVTTGDKLEVLDEVSGYLKVRTEKGVEGWIKKIYATAEKPAVIRLEELSKNTKGELGRLVELEKQMVNMKKSNTSLSEEIHTLRLEKDKLLAEMANAQVVVVKDEKAIFWILGLVIVFGIGFVLGKRWHQQQVMKRFGGLKI